MSGSNKGDAMENSDRELLELAATAAGYEILRTYSDGSVYIDPGPDKSGFHWSPLTDDGDALRLAVKLNLQVIPGTYRDHEATAFHAGKGEVHEHVYYQQDLYAATRRAIVRVAAEIGKALP